MQLVRNAIEEFMTIISVPCIGLCCVMLSLLAGGCDLVSLDDHNEESASTEPETSGLSSGGRLLIASGAEFQLQDDNGVRYGISAASISTVPRSIGAFNINRLNELFMERVQLNVFSAVSEKAGTSESVGQHRGISDSLRDYAEALPKLYGVISRVRMSDIEIVLHGAGKEGAPVRISADTLVKDFSDNEEPEMYNVGFFDDHSSNVLKVDRAVWNTQTDKFIVSKANVR